MTAFHRGRGGPGGWWILDEPELHLAPHVLVPDLAGWRRERMPRMPGTAYFTVVPDWVCEILSASTASLDRLSKLRIYAQHEVGHAWLVDPVARTVEIFRREGARWLLLAVHGGEERMRAEPFEAVELELAALWTPGPEPDAVHEPPGSYAATASDGP